MTNKEKCKQLKEIRKEIADKLGIDLYQQECTFKGECNGTCPKCEQEEEILRKALLDKNINDKKIIPPSFEDDKKQLMKLIEDKPKDILPGKIVRKNKDINLDEIKDSSIKDVEIPTLLGDVIFNNDEYKPIKKENLEEFPKPNPIRDFPLSGMIVPPPRHRKDKDKDKK